MAILRFEKDILVDESGEVFKIEEQDLIQSCLSNPYNTLSISEIVCQGVEGATGQKVVRRNCRKSSLFSRMEKAVQHDMRYQSKKTEALKIEHEKKEALKKISSDADKEYLSYMKNKG